MTIPDCAEDNVTFFEHRPQTKRPRQSVVEDDQIEEGLGDCEDQTAAVAVDGDDDRIGASEEGLVCADIAEVPACEDLAGGAAAVNDGGEDPKFSWTDFRSQRSNNAEEDAMFSWTDFRSERKKRKSEKKSAKTENEETEGTEATEEDPAERFPPACYCPITKKLLQDPVVMFTGESYEKSAITWETDSTTAYPNRALQAYIRQVARPASRRWGGSGSARSLSWRRKPREEYMEDLPGMYSSQPFYHSPRTLPYPFSPIFFSTSIRLSVLSHYPRIYD